MVLVSDNVFQESGEVVFRVSTEASCPEIVRNSIAETCESRQKKYEFLYWRHQREENLVSFGLPKTDDSFRQ